MGERGRCRRGARVHADRRRPHRHRAPHRRRLGRGRLRSRARGPVRLRALRAVGASDRRRRSARAAGDRRTRRGRRAGCPPPRRRPPASRHRDGRARRRGRCDADVVRIPPADPAAGRRRRRPRVDAVVLGRLRRDDRAPRTAPRGGRAVAAGAPGAHPPRHRRDRRRGDHVAARGLRRVPQLGLPLCVAARRIPHPRGAARARLHAHRVPLAALAAAGGRRRPRRRADHVRHRGGAGAARERADEPARIRGVGAGAPRQRCLHAVPGRRDRRGDGRSRGGPQRRRRRVGLLVGAAEGPAGSGRGVVRPTRLRHLGDPRRGDDVHPLAGDGVGGARPWCARREGDGAAGGRIHVGAPARPGARGDRRERLRRGARALRAALRLDGGRRVAAAPAPGGLLRPRRPAHARHRRRDGAHAHARRLPAALPHRQRRRRPPRRRASLPRLHVLARRAVRQQRPARRRR